MAPLLVLREAVGVWPLIYKMQQWTHIISIGHESKRARRNSLKKKKQRNDVHQKKKKKKKKKKVKHS